jgi:hypothetical protein
MFAVLLLLWIAVAGAEPMSPEGWRTLVRDAQRHVTAGTPQALVALRRLPGRQVRDPEGGVVMVDDREILGITQQLERDFASGSDPKPTLLRASLYLSMVQSEVDTLLERPPPPYSKAIRPDGTLFTTATRPLQPARNTSPWEPLVQASWGRVRAWVGIALSGRGPGGTGLTALVLVGTSLAALALALWPILRGHAPPATALTGADSTRWSATNSALGARLLAVLQALFQRGLLGPPAHLTNGEVAAALPDKERAVMAPALRIHDRHRYGQGPAGPAEHAVIEAALERLEDAP